eukprot:superscaffoldBa00005080_g19877
MLQRDKAKLAVVISERQKSFAVIGRMPPDGFKRKSLIATSLIVVVSLFVVVVNYSEKPYFLLQPVFGQTFSSHWMFSKQPYKAFKPHLGYVSIPKQE